MEDIKLGFQSDLRSVRAFNRIESFVFIDLNVTTPEVTVDHGLICNKVSYCTLRTFIRARE